MPPAIQERNEELVDLLTPDFLRRGEVSSDFITLGGINLGSATGAAAGELRTSGQVVVGGNITIAGSFGTVDITSAGTTAEFRVRNHSNTANSDAKLTLEIGGGTADNAYINFAIDGVLQKSMGYSKTKLGLAIVRGNDPTGGTNVAFWPNAGGTQLEGQLSSSTSIVATTGFGCNSKAAQTAFASGGAVVPGAGAFGASSAALFANLVTLVTNIRTALVNDGIMS